MVAGGRMTTVEDQPPVNRIDVEASSRKLIFEPQVSVRLLCHTVDWHYIKCIFFQLFDFFSSMQKGGWNYALWASDCSRKGEGFNQHDINNVIYGRHTKV